jgi:hypothetical protein
MASESASEYSWENSEEEVFFDEEEECEEEEVVEQPAQDNFGANPYMFEPRRRKEPAMESMAEAEPAQPVEHEEGRLQPAVQLPRTENLTW